MTTIYAEVPRVSFTGLLLSAPTWFAQAYVRRRGPLVVHLGGVASPAAKADLRLVSSADVRAKSFGSEEAPSASGERDSGENAADAQAFFPAVATWPRMPAPGTGAAYGRVAAMPSAAAVILRFPTSNRFARRRLRAKWRKSSSALRRMAILASIVSAIPLVLVAAVPITAIVRERSVWDGISRANAEASLVEVKDRSGRIIAYRRIGTGKGARKFRPMRQSPPAPFIGVLTFLEDRNTDAWYHLFGMDLRGLGRSVWCRVKDRERRGCGGGSTLVHQLVSGSHGRVGGQSYSEKWNELKDGWSVSLRFNLKDPATTRLLADSAPYAAIIDPNAGGDIWGLELGSYVLFGVEPSKLTIAQQALLASSIRSPLILSCRTLKPKWRDEQAQRWTKARDRAIFGLGGLDRESAEVAAARHELETMLPITRPAVLPPELADGLSRLEACEAAANPLRRGGLIWNWGLNAAAQEWAGVPLPATHGFSVGYDLVDQARFARRAEQALSTIEKSAGRKLAWRLTGNRRVAAILLVIVDRDGMVRRFYNNGPLLRFDTPRNPGSLGKLIVGGAASAEGNTPNQLCDLKDRFTGVRNADGSVGYESCVPQAMKSVEETFGRSLNLPILKLARDLDQASLDRSAAAFGAAWPGGMSKPNALVLGRVGISPQQMLGNMLALQSGLAGGGATAALPYLVTSAAARRPTVDLSFAFQSDSGRDFMRAVTQAALTHPKGTARVTPTLPLRQNEIAKTGTVDGPGDQAVLKWVTGATADGAYIAVIAAPSGVLGGGLSISPLTQLLRSELSNQTSDTTIKNVEKQIRLWN